MSDPLVAAFRLELLAVLLAASNFIVQLFTSRDWRTAAERTLFQFIAIFCAWVTLR